MVCLSFVGCARVSLRSRELNFYGVAGICYGECSGEQTCVGCHVLAECRQDILMHHSAVTLHGHRCAVPFLRILPVVVVCLYAVCADRQALNLQRKLSVHLVCRVECYAVECQTSVFRLVVGVLYVCLAPSRTQFVCSVGRTRECVCHVVDDL